MTDADTRAADETLMDRGLAGLRSNVREGFRLAFFRPSRPGALYFSWGQLLALVGLNLLLSFVAEFIYIGRTGVFRTEVLPEYLFLVPDMLFAWVVGRLANDEAAIGRYLIALLASALPIVLAIPLVLYAYPLVQESSYPWLVWPLYYCLSLWYTAAAAVAAIRLHGLNGRRATAAFMLAGIFLMAPAYLIRSGNWLWTPQTRPDTSSESRVDYYAPVREDSFYRQPLMLDRALAAVQPGRRGQVELFFIGAAGYAPEDVFMKEVNSVAELFEQRFGTAGRSIRLINNQAALESAPIASVTALRRSLLRMGEQMNDDDILFLFLTSHGSSEHRFSLRFGPLRFKELDPTVLRSLLDESGIRRRAVVVSACYSGGFVEALKGDDTLVITAAAPDRNSFGCSNENDYTYFGKAYFDEALRKTYSFVEAFEMAKPVIAVREEQEDHTPSDPQISIGKNIAPALEAYARQLERDERRKPATAGR